MQFGVFDHLDNDHLPLDQYYGERLKIIERYDQAGFHSYHLAEHHATTLGMAPSPNVFLSAVAQRTTQLRFGPMVYALPLYHPLRLVEEIAMIDQMSGGRLDIGFGRGSSPTEASYFGIDPGNTEIVFQAHQRKILDALETGVMHFPEQEDPYRDIILKVLPFQKPTPRIWYGVHTVRSADRAARMGWATINLDLADEARECNITFRKVWGEVHGSAPLPLMGLGRFVVVAETNEKAHEIARRAYPHWHRGFTLLSRQLGLKSRHPRPDNWDELCSLGKGIAGNPASVAAFLSLQLTTSQCNYCVGQFAFGDQSFEELETSVNLFAGHVMPVLRSLDTLSELH